MDLDAWQGQLMADLPNLPVERRPGAVDTLVRISDQRLKLFGLYARPGAGGEEMPTGPITLELRIIPPGNRVEAEEPGAGETEDLEDWNETAWGPMPAGLVEGGSDGDA